MKNSSFLEFLSEQHARSYNWIDDSMPDAFEEYLEAILDDELIAEFELYIQKYPNKIVAKELRILL